jgi:hypothetical protein
LVGDDGCSDVAITPGGDDLMHERMAIAGRRNASVGPAQDTMHRRSAD